MFDVKTRYRRTEVNSKEELYMEDNRNPKNLELHV